ncbi:MAG: tRNA (adenosine(37)-N6)-threonylcarbamoyltransferase complex dimerization subunit type 1 TsaB [Bacteroidales bacterium]|nr:tRNA (adenosine(37)-N6)-threonylcarbamoyltransferase complex dimerization subunit type 1 TsaB [Bacteroidales bacterium]
MSYFINIETSTDICSVALSSDNQVIDYEENHNRNHASTLAAFIEKVLKRNNLTTKQLSAVATSLGPGSYTGLRIGTSTAKGMAYAADIKLITVDTLKAMAKKAAENFKNEKAIIVSCIDAGRNEVYSEIFDVNNNVLRSCQAELIEKNSFQEYFDDNYKVVFAGNASEKISKIIENSNAVFLFDVLPSARYMAELTFKAFSDKQFADVAYFEPFYLKDFIATVSKKNVLKT